MSKILIELDAGEPFRLNGKAYILMGFRGHSATIRDERGECHIISAYTCVNAAKTDSGDAGKAQ